MKPRVGPETSMLLCIQQQTNSHPKADADPNTNHLSDFHNGILSAQYNTQKNSRFYPGKIRGKIGNDAMHLLLLNQYFVGMMMRSHTVAKQDFLSFDTVKKFALQKTAVCLHFSLLVIYSLVSCLFTF